VQFTIAAVVGVGRIGRATVGGVTLTVVVVGGGVVVVVVGGAVVVVGLAVVGGVVVLDGSCELFAENFADDPQPATSTSAQRLVAITLIPRMSATVSHRCSLQRTIV
jgi:hypothetical protein